MDLTATDVPGVLRIVSTKPILVLGMLWTNNKGHKWSDVTDGAMSGAEVALAGQEIFVAPRKTWRDRSAILPPPEIWRGEIDFVLFSDGEQFGPDRSKTFENLLVRSKEMVELADGVLRGRLTMADLEHIASVDPISEDDFVAMWRQRAARALMTGSALAASSGRPSPAATIKYRHEQILRLLNRATKED